VGPLRPSAPPSAVSRVATTGGMDSGQKDEAMGGGLGKRDAEGTAVELDDGASEWEDCEETRIFGQTS
jgi:hypothetical protein